MNNIQTGKKGENIACNYLIKNGYAYETSKGIYFDISKLDNYNVFFNQKSGCELTHPLIFLITISYRKMD